MEDRNAWSREGLGGVFSLWKSARKRVRKRTEGERMQRSWATGRKARSQGREGEEVRIDESWIMEVPWAWGLWFRDEGGHACRPDRDGVAVGWVLLW